MLSYLKILWFFLVCRIAAVNQTCKRWGHGWWGTQHIRKAFVGCQWFSSSKGSNLSTLLFSTFSDDCYISMVSLSSIGLHCTYQLSKESGSSLSVFDSKGLMYLWLQHLGLPPLPAYDPVFNWVTERAFIYGQRTSELPASLSPRLEFLFMYITQYNSCS